MVRKTFVVWTLIASSVLAVPASAQTPEPVQTPAQAASPAPRLQDLRHQIYVMEGALMRAVAYGAQQLNRELRTISPEAVMLSGDPQARGIFLEGYGVFFDVGVPILRQSMMWSLRTIIQQDEESLRQTIDILRMQLKAQPDPLKRKPIEDTIARLEMQIGGPFSARAQPQQRPPMLSAPAQGVGAAMVAPETAMPGKPAPPPPPPPASPTLSAALQDPNRAYTEAVQRALIDAMIDYAAPMLIGQDEWLTVAARDNEPRDSFAPQDPAQEVVTVVLRIKGADLAAYRSGKIDRDEAKKRVQVREF